jgi:hypothetical protein
LENQTVPGVSREIRSQPTPLSPDDPLASGEIEFSYPPQVAIHEDFTVGLLMKSRAGTFQRSSYSAHLYAPESAKARTSDVCNPPPNDPNATAACAEAQSSLFAVDWDITPNQEGTEVLRLVIPEALIRALTPDERDWAGKAHQLVASSLGGSSEPPTSQLGPSKTTGRLDSAVFDLSKREIRLSVEVIPTLGVRRSTYNSIALIATFASGALGTGWIWQFLTWLRTRQKPTSAIVTSR